MKRFLFVILVAIVPIAARADVHVPDVIGSSMVLQQRQAVPVWGTADPGQTVTVTFGGQRKTAVAGGDGKWRVDLGKLNANFTPRTMTIAGKNTIELKDILVG